MANDKGGTITKFSLKHFCTVQKRNNLIYGDFPKSMAESFDGAVPEKTHFTC